MAATTVTDTGADFAAAGLQPGDIALLNDGAGGKAAGQISSVSATSFEVSSWAFGAPAAGWAYEAGPPFDDCGYTVPECILRKMFGPNDQQAEQALNLSTRRYFAANAPPAVVTAFPKIPSEGRKRFQRTTQGNRGIEGKVIPDVVGRVTVHEIPALAWFDAGEFTHALFPAGNARCSRLYDIRSNDDPPDDNDPGNALAEPWRDSLILYGFDDEGGANDQAAVASGELTQEEQKRGVGSRESFLRGFNQVLDSYIRNPYLFTGDSGQGVSLSQLSGVRLRTEPQGGFREGASAKMALLGRKFLRLDGAAWTARPDPIEYAHRFAEDPLLGGGMAPADLDLAWHQAESAFCRELVASPQSGPTVGGGGGGDPPIDEGPGDGDTPVVNPNSRAWAFAQLPAVPAAYIGATLKVTEPGKESEREIVAALPRPSLEEFVRDPVIGGGHGYVTSAAARGKRGAFLLADQPYSEAELPAAGDAFQIVRSAQRPRYMANGVMDQDLDVGETLEVILKNCNASFVTVEGRLRFVIRKAVDLGQVAQLPTVTDFGPDRNVVVRGGETTAQWSPDPVDQAPNSITVEFLNPQKEYQSDRFVIKNTQAILELKKRFGQSAQRFAKTLSLSLTTDFAQAARLGALALREQGPISFASGVVRRNGRLEWEMAAHDAMAMIPHQDVYPAAFERAPSWIEYVRILEVEEANEKATCKVAGRPHFNEFYDDTFVGLEIGFPVADDPGAADYPLPVRWESLEEGLIVDEAGRVIATMLAKVTLP